MEKTISALKNTGVKRVEIFILRFCATKSKLLEQYMEGKHSAVILDPISFNHGMLAGIPNKFLLKISEISLSGVQLFISPPELLNKDAFAVQIAGIKLLLQENGTVCHWEKLEREGKVYKCRKNSSQREWPDSVNELRFEIAVSQATRLQFKVTEDVSVSLPTPTPVIDLKSRRIDVSKYFLSAQFSDASIKCDGEIFPVHMFVLAECSPVFTKMFEHNTKEAETRIVEITEFHSATVQALLRYFYEQTINYSDINVFQLYKLSDKYLVGELNTLCATFLISNMNRDNVAEVYCFGRKHEDQNLTKAAEDFLCKNKKELIKNHREFQAFLCDIRPSFVDDIFQILWQN